MNSTEDVLEAYNGLIGNWNIEEIISEIKNSWDREVMADLFRISASLITTIESQKEEIERLTEMKIQRIEIENGAINFSIQGEAGMSFAAILLRFFEDNGGKNFFTFDVDKNEMRFSITIENKNGELTVTEKLNRQFKEIESLKAITELSVKGFNQIADDVIRCNYTSVREVATNTLSEIARLSQ